MKTNFHEEGLKSDEIALKSDENDSNGMKFTEITQNYVQSMISWIFKIIEITHVIVWNQVLIEIICTVKQEVNGPSM